MELVEDSSYYRNDLTEQDGLELIPRGLGLAEVEEGGQWLCCRYCVRKDKSIRFPTGHGIKSHFAVARHDPQLPPDPAPSTSQGPQIAPPPPPTPKQSEDVLPPSTSSTKGVTKGKGLESISAAGHPLLSKNLAPKGRASKCQGSLAPTPKEPARQNLAPPPTIPMAPSVPTPPDSGAPPPAKIGKASDCC